MLEMVEKGTLSAGHARALLSVKEPAQQLAAAKRVSENGMSVRQTEELSVRLQKGPSQPKKPAGDGVDYTREAERQLTDAMGRVVRISGGAKGRITLEYYSADDREALMSALAKIKKK